MAKAKVLRLHQAVAQKIGTAILCGDLPPGTHFDGEIESSAAYGVSRTAYREALKLLNAKGLIQSRPKAGTFVNQRSHWHLLDPEILAWTYSGEPDPGTIRDLFELRSIIEPAAASLAAQRASDEQIASMGRALDAMARLGLQSEKGREADQEFHRLILEAAGNTALFSLASSVGSAVTWTTRFKQRRKPLPRDPEPDHRAVWLAIRDRNPAAADAAMRELLVLALEDMKPEMTGG